MRTCARTVMLLAGGAALAPLCLPTHADAQPLHRYWPRFPRPRVVLTVPEVRSPGEAFLLQSAAGLAAKGAIQGRNREMVWYPIGHPAYVEWRQRMLSQTKAKIVELADVWQVVLRLRKAGLVRGYILFREDVSSRRLHERGEYDPSANVATVMAGKLDGVLVSESLEPRAREHGLSLLADARRVSEEQCFERWGSKCSRRVLAMLDPRVPHCRAEAIALDAFVLATYGPLLERALARLEPDSPVLGWGMGDEYRLTEPISRYAAWQSATNWCLNLPVLSTEEIGRTFPISSVRTPSQSSIWDLDWRDDVHYAAFLMSDGDNVQWLMGDFQFGAERSWWNSPARGKVPMGWGVCAADLAQLCPYALANLVQTATAADDLVLMGGGYYYPDLFGAARNREEALRLHARRIRGYMAMAGLRVLHMNASQWDSPEAVRAYTIFAQEIPELEGILMVQYAPYSAGKGRVIWVQRRDGSQIPVVAARFGLWAHSPFPDDGPPAEIARRINAMPTVGTGNPQDGFSWVTVHCWSWFREASSETQKGAEEVDQAKARELGARRGMEPVVWCTQRLAPHIQVLKPSEFVRMLALRLHPKEALDTALRELERKRSPGVRTLLVEARARWRAGDWRGAWELGRTVYRNGGAAPESRGRGR